MQVPGSRAAAAPRQRRSGLRAALALGVVGAGLVFAGVRAMPTSVGAEGQVPPLSTTAPPSEPASSAPVAPDRAFAPAAVRLPSLDVNAQIVPVAVGPDRLLAVPSDVRAVGWWRDGARAGAARGTVVLVGHVDSAVQGPGAFFRLRRIQPGDRIQLASAGGIPATYSVVARRQYPKTALPADLVFGQGAQPRLVLITCGGRFDTGTRHYTDNVVVFAVPAR